MSEEPNSRTEKTYHLTEPRGSHCMAKMQNPERSLYGSDHLTVNYEGNEVRQWVTRGICKYKLCRSVPSRSCISNLSRVYNLARRHISQCAPVLDLQRQRPCRVYARPRFYLSDGHVCVLAAQSRLPMCEQKLWLNSPPVRSSSLVRCSAFSCCSEPRRRTAEVGKFREQSSVTSGMEPKA